MYNWGLTRHGYGYILKIGKVISLINIKDNNIMPRFNGTGPLGSGSGTGWGRGPCGCGMGWRRGWRRGWLGRFFGQPKITEKEKTEILEEDAQVLEQELKTTKERLTELKGKE